MKAIRTFFAKRKYGKSYESKLALAQGLSRHIKASTVAKPNHFVDSKGQIIRGWHKNVRLPVVGSFHPLEVYYKNK
jgi:hypothetical protein